MQRILTSLAAASALALCASVAQADCYGGHAVTASAAPAGEAVTIATHDEPAPPLSVETIRVSAPGGATECAAGEKDCAEGTN